MQYLKENVKYEVDFLNAEKLQSFLQVDFNTLGIKLSYKVILSLLMVIMKHSQGNSNKFVFTQMAFTFSKLIIETLEQGVKYVQS